MPKVAITSKHGAGKRSAAENRIAAQRARVRTRAHMSRYRLRILARKKEVEND